MEPSTIGSATQQLEFVQQSIWQGVERKVDELLRDKGDLAQSEYTKRLQHIVISFLDQLAHFRTAIEQQDSCDAFSWSSKFLGLVNDDLTRCRRMLETLSFSASILGSMKTGKSTFVNALVGWKVSPKRPTACTIFPVKIMRRLDGDVPILYFQHTELFNRYILPAVRARYAEMKDIIASRAESFEEITHELESLDVLCPLLKGCIEGDYQAKEWVEGEADILRELEILNDLVRILLKDSFYYPAVIPYLLEVFGNVDYLPVIFVPPRGVFADLEGVGDICLIDTPGPDESLDIDDPASPCPNFLYEIVTRVLRQVNYAVLATNHSQVQTTREAKMRDLVIHFKSNLTVVATRYDEFEGDEEDDQNYQKVQNIVKAAFPRYQGYIFAPTQVFPICTTRYVTLSWLDEILKSEENPKIPTKDPRWRELTTQFRGLFTPSDIDDMREVLPEHLQQTHFQELIGHMKENVIGTSALHSIAEAVALVNFITSRLLANYVLTVQDALVINSCRNAVEAIKEQVAERVDEKLTKHVPVVIDQVVGNLTKTMQMVNQQIALVNKAAVVNGIKGVFANNESKAAAIFLFGDSLLGLHEKKTGPMVQFYPFLASRCITHMYKQILFKAFGSLKTGIVSQKFSLIASGLAGTISSELRQAIREHIPNVPSDSRIFEAADISVGVFSDWGLEADKLSHVTVDLDISTVGDVKSNFVVRLLKIAADKARLAQVDLVNRIARDLQEKTRLFEKSIMVGFKGLLNLMKGANGSPRGQALTTMAQIACLDIQERMNYLKTHFAELIRDVSPRVSPDVLRLVTSEQTKSRSPSPGIGATGIPHYHPAASTQPKVGDTTQDSPPRQTEPVSAAQHPLVVESLAQQEPERRPQVQTAVAGEYQQTSVVFVTPVRPVGQSGALAPDRVPSPTPNQQQPRTTSPHQSSPVVQQQQPQLRMLQQQAPDQRQRNWSNGTHPQSVASQTLKQQQQQHLQQKRQQQPAHPSQQAQQSQPPLNEAKIDVTNQLMDFQFDGGEDSSEPGTSMVDETSTVQPDSYQAPPQQPAVQPVQLLRQDSAAQQTQLLVQPQARAQIPLLQQQQNPAAQWTPVQPQVQTQQQSQPVQQNFQQTKPRVQQQQSHYYQPPQMPQQPQQHPQHQQARPQQQWRPSGQPQQQSQQPQIPHQPSQPHQGQYQRQMPQLPQQPQQQQQQQQRQQQWRAPNVLRQGQAPTGQGQ